MKRYDIVHDDLRLAVVEAGGAGPTILFCHGNSFSSSAFALQFVPELTEQFRLLAMDLPGHGDSSRATDPARTYSLGGYGRAVATVCNQLATESVLLVGWSLGGHVVLQACSQVPACAGVLITGAPPLRKPAEIDQAFLPNPAFASAMRAESSDEDIDALLNAVGVGSPGKDSRFRQSFVSCDPEARASLVASVVAGDYDDEQQIIASLQVPLAIVSGKRDALVNRRYLEAVDAPTLWRGAIQDVDSGHAPQWETPARFNRLVRAFAAEVLT